MSITQGMKLIVYLNVSFCPLFICVDHLQLVFTKKQIVADRCRFMLLNTFLRYVVSDLLSFHLLLTQVLCRHEMALRLIQLYIKFLSKNADF